jgi:hypothetical protein
MRQVVVRITLKILKSVQSFLHYCGQDFSRPRPTLGFQVCHGQITGAWPKGLQKDNVDTNKSYGERNAPIDESRAAGDTDILDNLVPRLLVCAATADETAYSGMPEPMEELAKRIQRGDAFAKEKLQQLNHTQGTQAERSPWEICQKIYPGMMVAHIYPQLSRLINHGNEP